VEVKPAGEVVSAGSRKHGWRRSIYTLQRRSTPTTMLEVFDLPPMSPNCIQRSYSTVPTQALELTHSEVMRDRARYWAGRLIDQFGGDQEKQIEQIYLQAFARRPTAEETRLAIQDLAELSKQWAVHFGNEKFDAPRAASVQWAALAVLNLKPPEELPDVLVAAQRSLARRLQESHRQVHPGYPDLDARITSFELAARMQLSATDALDLSQESEQTREMYGLNQEATSSYGKRCLMARRLVERGVRFVQIFIEYQIWDAHSDLDKSLRYSAGKTDQPAAALIKDLKQRGLLDSTLVVWGGEFGRMPISQARTASAGRDHGPSGFSIWMAGGGVKRGHVHGATDDIGHKAVENRVSVHDFHATLLHLLGLNFRDMVYERNGNNLEGALEIDETGLAPFDIYYPAPLPVVFASPYTNRLDGGTHQPFPYNTQNFNWSLALPLGGYPVPPIDQKVPYTETYNLTLQRQFGSRSLSE
jgi:hypothetical protein